MSILRADLNNIIGRVKGLIVTAVLACCAIAPAAQASVTDRISFEVRPTAKFQVIEAGGGFQTLLVVANAPFDVSIEGVVGEVNIDMTATGHAQGRSFGGRAQSPGPSADTVNVASAFETVIYEGQRGTAASQGSLLDQAIKLTISYDQMAEPQISVSPQD